MKSLSNYLTRINVQGDDVKRSDRVTLALIIESQSRSIAFENVDVIMKKPISIARSDVERKLVDNSRGGYCFEQNTLLQMALEEMGYVVTPLMCRVRWGKPDDTQEPNTGFTHFSLKVRTSDGCHYLADVGFAGSNSMEPVNLGIGQEPQDLPEGRFRVVPSKHKDFDALELAVKDEWRPLYEWHDEKEYLVDQECSNWFSCTHPKARFTSQFFTCRIVGNERHHIRNDTYVIRKGHGMDAVVTNEKVTDKDRLLELIGTVFGVKLVQTEGIDRYIRNK